MQDLNDKVTGSSLAASEWNQVPSELQNVITALGQSLTAADLNQLGKAIAGYAGSGNAFVDGGTANAIVLSPVTGLQAPPQYTNLQAVRFIKNGTNTGAVTANVAGLGVLNVLDQFGASLASGDLQNGSRYTIEYSLTIDGGSPGFVFEKASGLANDLPRGYLDGYILSNNAIDPLKNIDITDGACKNSNNSSDLLLSSALGKQIDVSWAEGGTPGAPSGGFPSLLSGGVAQPDTTYFVFAILKNTGQVDAGFDTSLNAVNLLADATDYSDFRRIGFVITDSSSDIINGFWYGDKWQPNEKFTEYTGTASAGPVVRQFSRIPNGLKLKAGITLTARSFDVTPSSLLVTDPDNSAQSPTPDINHLSIEGQGGNAIGFTNSVEVVSDNQAQLRFEWNNSLGDFDTAFVDYILDTRGKS